jgi:hypothetical protein
MKHADSWSCYSRNTGFLHRAADLTLVPSAAISKDFETAQVISGWTFFYTMYQMHICFYSCHDAKDVISLLVQLIEYAFGTKVLILQASILDSAVMRCESG